jgi:hypothetical protein
MAAIPGEVETDQQPPMTIPLQHFVVGLGLLLIGVVVGVGIVFDVVPGFGTLVHVHLLLVGWICITIMGAMTQFVPVWSGVALHSRRFASIQLTFVLVGLGGFAAGLLLNSLAWLIPFGGLMFAGFWIFVYNIARTMASIDSYDVTERHFLLALGFFLVVTGLGFLLAVDFTRPIFAPYSIGRINVVTAHATIGVFGVILTTIYGALYQLGTMFTQTELHGVDEYLQLIEEVGHPVGVVLLAVGRFADTLLVGRIGGVLVVGAALAFSTILARKLYETQVDWMPMHTRYAVVAPGLASWAVVTTPAWLRDPLALEHLFGANGAVHLFVLGTVGFVIVGTLYHIIPFIIWVHRYSDRLGLEEVPMIDDLYDDRVAAADGILFVSGTLLLVVSEWFHLSSTTQAMGGGLVALGVVVFSANILAVIWNHSPHSIGGILIGSLSLRQESPSDSGSASRE